MREASAILPSEQNQPTRVTNVTAAAQAALVTGDTIREFLKANGVDAAGESTDATASVVRVISVRK